VKGYGSLKGGTTGQSFLLDVRDVLFVRFLEELLLVSIVNTSFSFALMPRRVGRDCGSQG